jgi:hypothetical protein
MACGSAVANMNGLGPMPSDPQEALQWRRAYLQNLDNTSRTLEDLRIPAQDRPSVDNVMAALDSLRT